MIQLGRDILNVFPQNSSYEWLVTNGIGGYASGTASGVLTRRYHGLLMAALKPPLGRTLLVTKMDEIATVHNVDYDLYTTQWGEERVTGIGFQHMNRFYLDGGVPVWEFGFGDAVLEKRIWMAQEENTTYVQYTYINGLAPLELTLSPFVNYRDYHGSTYAGNWQMRIESMQQEQGLEIKAFPGSTPIFIQCPNARMQPRHIWFYSHYLSMEAYRGLTDREDHLLAGIIEISLQPGESAGVVLSTNRNVELDAEKALIERKSYEQAIIKTGGTTLTQGSSSDNNLAIETLMLAADQFVVNRPTGNDADGKSIIAGYPWFSDWGRDTMISLPGLTLSTGRPEIAQKILQTYGRHVDQGMLPNRFPDSGDTPEYNTADATLWYFVAIRAYVRATNDHSLLRRLYPILEEIIDWHKKGTRYNIHMTDDGLLYTGEAGVQLTWMDAKVDDWVVTPRTGKPIEINALWYNAICMMAEFAQLLGYRPEAHQALAERIEDGFTKFWHRKLGYCYDILESEGPIWNDFLLRPNQLLAVSLPYSPLTAEQQKQVVDVCATQLYTPFGMRSLAPSEDDYVGVYGGDRRERDGAYHQGTTWGWLIGPFIEAHYRVYQDIGAAERYLAPLLDQINSGCLGSAGEIFDGDPPFTPRGCLAQAWTVAEILRVYELIHATRGRA